MNAAEIARLLGDARREGRAWRCRCPLHDGRSLGVRDGEAGRVLVTCWGGCDRLDVLAELRQHGLLDGPSRYQIPAPRRDDMRRNDAARTACALPIWRDARPITGTIAETYLTSRGIKLDQWPAALRFHPQCPRPRDETKLVSPLPALVTLVEHVDRGPVAIQCIYLRSNGSDKAPVEPDKAFFGRVKGGAVRLGAPRENQWFLVGEGIETTLSAAALYGVSPAWAALSAKGIENLVLPSEARMVLICADHDRNGVGQSAACDAATRWGAEGRRIRIEMPSEPGSDFNDLLRCGSGSRIKGARHAA
jgi:putative DNA primase/helicase